MTSHVTLKVRGLSSPKNAKEIRNHLDDLSGISDIHIDLEDGKVIVDYNSQNINTATIVSKIEGMGYDVIQNAIKNQG